MAAVHGNSSGIEGRRKSVKDSHRREIWQSVSEHPEEMAASRR